jgi:hypothetical protein
MLVVVRRSFLVLASRMAVSVTAGSAIFVAVAAVGCQRSDPPPGTPAEVAPCPADAGTELPRELACCLIQARTGEEAQICLAKADAGR